MFPRGRPCLKRCGLLATFVEHAAGRAPHHDEPLLFLYPRWSTTKAKQQRRPLSTSLSRQNPSRQGSAGASRAAPPRSSGVVDTSSEESLPSRDATPTQFESGYGQKDQPLPRRQGTVTVQPTGRAIKRAVNAINQDGPPGKGGREGPGSSLSDYIWGFSAGAPRSQRKKVNKSRLFRPPPKKPPSPTHHASKQPESQGPARISRRDSVRELSWSQLNPEGLSPATMFTSAKNALVLAESRSIRDGGFAEQSLYKADLFEEQRRELHVPEETVALFAGVSAEFAGAENIWYEQLRYGCKVHVLPPVESVGQNRKIILWGSPRSTELVANHILEAQKLQEGGDPLIGIQKPAVPIFPSRQALDKVSFSVPLVRGVWSQVSRTPENYDTVVSRLSKVSTVRDFAEYVEQLTMSLPSDEQYNHRHRVTNGLLDLFSDHDKMHLLSTGALNVAASYLLKVGSIKNDVLELFNRGKHVATTESFNLLLKNVVRNQNLRFLAPVLQAMSRLRIAPDINSWLAYVRCLPSPKQRRGMIKELERRGYLKTTNATRAVLQSMIQDLFHAHLQRGESVDKFFYKTVMPAGLNWFPPSLLKQMFTVTVERDDAAAMKQLLKICETNKLSLTTPIVSDIIHFFPNDTFTAVHYALQCLDKPQADFDQLTYQRLFQIAFNNKHYNLCRVLWRYACMNGAVTKPMRDTMSFLLLQNTAKVGTARDNQWWTCAAKVIAGVSLHLPDYPLKEVLLEVFPPEFHSSPISALVTTRMVEGEERGKQRFMARAIVKHDYQIGAWYRPQYSLAHMLEAAAELDREWASKPRTANWLISNAIHVPIELVGHVWKKGLV